MRKYIENLYNSNDIYTILCTSTLLEGINTPTSELIVYDSNNLSAFKLNNLIGRVGRLNSFQKGLVYLFDKDLQKYLIGNDKYEEITIVAETNDITDLEEAVYLNKSIDDLDEDNLDLYNRLIEILARYGKTLEDLKNTDGFVIREFIQLFDNLDSILLKADKYIKAEEKEKYLIKNDIIESFVKIIKYTRQYMLVEINNNIKIYGGICMRKIHECAEDIKNILNDAERTEEVDGDMLCSINELVDEILSIYCLEKQQRKMAIAEENEILSEEAKKAGWKSGVMNI